MQAIVQKIEEHANVLLDNKKDKLNRHWSATRVIKLSQALVKVLPPSELANDQNEPEMENQGPERMSELMVLIKADSVLALGDDADAKAGAQMRLHRYAIEMEVCAAIAEITFNEILRKCNYSYIGIPPPNVLVKD